MLQFFGYKIPFKQPFATASGTYRYRSGIIIHFQNATTEGWGELAPLPGFSEETVEQLVPILLYNRRYLDEALNEGDRSFIESLQHIHNIPSLSFGLDTLWYDVQARLNHHTMAEELFGATTADPECNAIVGMHSQAQTIQHVQEYVEQGFSTFKVKVGINFEQEFSILKEVRQRFPNIKIRIDANGAWNTEDAIINLNLLSPLNVEYCEQPVSELSDFEQVAKQIPVSLAVDEGIRNKQEAMQLTSTMGINLLILKPMLFGAFRDMDVTIRACRTHGIDVVFTTSLEYQIGRTVTAVLASGWGAPQTAHGLATGSLFQQPYEMKQEIIEGSFIIPVHPGHGITPDRSTLHELVG
ncbi:MAG: o-succinylbenzoate synthase [Bacteroidota bacterium]